MGEVEGERRGGGLESRVKKKNSKAERDRMTQGFMLSKEMQKKIKLGEM